MTDNLTAKNTLRIALLLSLMAAVLTPTGVLANGGLGDWETVSGEWQTFKAQEKTSIVQKSQTGMLKWSSGPRDDFALHFRARHSERTAFTSVLFRASDEAKGYDLRLARYLSGMKLLLPNGESLGWHRFTVEPDTWYEVKVQAKQTRISVKCWKAGDEEPPFWHIDLFDPKLGEGHVFLRGDGPDGAYADVREIAPEELPAPHPSANHLLKRFPDGHPKPETPPCRIVETDRSITIKGECAEITFERSRCAVSKARIRGLELDNLTIPNLFIQDEQGRTYSQSKTSDGNLGVLRSFDERFIVLGGLFTPTSEAGEPFPSSFRVEYRIHRCSGLMIAKFICVGRDEPRRRVRKLVFYNTLNDNPSDGIDDLNYADYGWGKASTFRIPEDVGTVCHMWNVRGNLPRDKELIGAEWLAYATWSNGRAAFELQPLDYANCSIWDRFTRDDTKEKYLTIANRNGHRSLDMVYVNQVTPMETTIPFGTMYQFTFSFLPFRKYRPNVRLLVGSKFWDVDQMNSISWRRQIAERTAQMGGSLVVSAALTRGDGSDIGDFVDPKGMYVERLRKVTADAHYYGLENYPSMLGLHTDVAGCIANGWMSLDDVINGRLIDSRRYNRHTGVFEGHFPENARSNDAFMCMEYPKYRSILLEKMIGAYFKDYDADGIYIDVIQPIFPCENRLHGHREQGVPVLGHVEFLDDFHKMTRGSFPQKTVFLHSSHTYTNAQAMADLTFPGEIFHPRPWYPNQAEMNTVMTSLIHGIQTIYITSSAGVATASPRVYETALATCSLVMGRTDFTPQERRMFVDYMTPLLIFNANTSEVHHPYEVDYERYAQAGKGVVAVIYSRPGEALVVVVKQDAAVKRTDVRLNLGALGVKPENAVVFDTIARTLARRLSTSGDTFQLRGVDVSSGPRIFVIRERKQPGQLIWHDQIVWRAQQDDRGKWTAYGVPGAVGKLYLSAAAKVRPQGAKVSLDTSSNIATVEVKFNEAAEAMFSLF